MTDDLEQDVHHLWGLLFVIVADMEKRLAAHFAAHDLTPPQFYVLKTLTEKGGRCFIGEIAREHHLTNATMTGLISRLEALGLVSRQRSAEDRRSVVVTLTQAGQARFAAVQNDLLAQVRTIVAQVDAQSRRDIIYYVGRYIEDVIQQFPAVVLSPPDGTA